MRRRLGPDSPLSQAIGQFADAVVLNLLFVLCALPGLTAGASWTALEAVMLENARGDQPRVGRRFFHHFAARWRGATLLWLAWLAAVGLLAWEYGILAQFPQEPGVIVAQALVVTGWLCVALWAVWAFPLIADGHPPLRATRLAARLAIGHLPRSATVLAVAAVAPGLVWLVDDGWQFVVPLMAVVGCALIALVNAMVVCRALPAATA